ncbi:uncharacterized protein LOC119650261 isoform X2 [Hermetia illucens]|uniref:uncharacterized protein LOC119650261 isoform X2 n=1 Tax=Hermetia illucens TaxID=343691 RepID=UPI0018CC125B|nr:uncharacterized protein LOC119650261 isoform X2 [Hermetia illucens]
MEFWWIHHSTARSYIILPWPYMYAAKGSDDISLKTLALSAYARFTRFSHNIVFFITARRRLLFSYSRPTLRTIEDDRVDHTVNVRLLSPDRFNLRPSATGRSFYFCIGR